MTGLEIFETQKETIKEINEMLQASPLVAGSIIIDRIYRKEDMKPKGINNYAQIGFRETFSRHGLNCSLNQIKGLIDVFSTNEIMTSRLAYGLVDKLYNAKINDVEYITKCGCVDGVVRLTTNEYVQRVEFTLLLV